MRAPEFFRFGISAVLLMQGFTLTPAQTRAEGPAPAAPRLIQTADGKRSWMTEEEVADLARRAHEEGHCGGFMDVTEHPSKQPGRGGDLGALGILGFLGTRVPTQQGQVDRLLPELSAARIMDSVAHLSAYQNRFYKSETGAEAARWIRDEFLRLARGRTDVTAELVQHGFQQPSVIVRISGQGAKAKERVVLGAHEDSINRSGFRPSPRDRAPGADDDASGVATLLETFRVLMDSGYRPERTLEFMTYAGEEVGLLGSQDVAEKYRTDRLNVVAVLQLDMTLYPGNDPRIHMISDHTNRTLTRFVEMLIDTYVHVPWVEMTCGYACSDHASWTDAGYPSAFPFEAPMDSHNPKIHTADDTADLLTPTFGLHFAQLATAFAVELASER